MNVFPDKTKPETASRLGLRPGRWFAHTDRLKEEDRHDRPRKTVYPIT